VEITLPVNIMEFMHVMAAAVFSKEAFGKISKFGLCIILLIV